MAELDVAMEGMVMTRQERFYLVVGACGLVVLAIAWLVRPAEASVVVSAAYLLGAVVVVAWAVAGVASARRTAREARERAAAAERQRAAQEAARRAAQQVNARRTTSHAGQTISVRRVSSASLQGDAADCCGESLSRAGGRRDAGQEEA